MAKQQKIKIFVLSTSISIHYGPYLKKALGKDFEYSRKTGEEPELINHPELQTPNTKNTELTKKYLELMQNSFKTDILILGLGLHDIRIEEGLDSLQVSIEKYEENLKEIITLAQKVTNIVIWVSTTDFNEELHNNSPGIKFKRFKKDGDAYHHIALKVMRENNIPIIDLRKFTQSLGEDIFIDHCHFTEDVRKQQGEFIAESVRKII